MRYEVPIFVASALLFAVYAGCSGGETSSTTGQSGAGGAGGATSTTTTVTTTIVTTTTSVASTSGPTSTSVGSGMPIDTCDGAPDGLCIPNKLEDCNCVDCEGSAMCVPDLCTTDGFCASVWDSCTCPDCDTDYNCADPAKKNCKDDGVCDSYHEGCLCADCEMKPDCLDNRVACAGGAPDGTCDLTMETCECVDCFGRAGCLPCIADSVCDSNEPCYCPECKLGPYCANPKNCENDGLCDAADEGCQCDDCAGIPECNGGSSLPATSVGSGTTTSGSGGGMGGMGGMAGSGGTSMSSSGP